MAVNRLYEALAETLKGGGVGVMPTDTLYGIVGSALNKKAVERIYRLRRRNLKKPMIILIGSLDDLKPFNIATTPVIKKMLKKVWPGKISVIVPCISKKFIYLHRGTKTLAFRLPKSAFLTAILKKTGPIIAPSANIEGKPPARTVKEARRYFRDNVDFYVDAGRRVSRPSTLVAVRNGGFTIVRQGAVKI